MSQSRTIPETEICDGKGGKVTVRAGDQIDLLPYNHEEYDGVPGISISSYSKGLYEPWLGPGPYTIASIAEWPCGGITLYINTPNGKKGEQPGVKPEEFCIAS